MNICISKINNNNNYNNYNIQTKKPTFTSQSQEFTPSSQLEQFKKAQQYVNSILNRNQVLNLDKCDLKKLEGIQHGIKVFEGVNIQQIYLLYKYLAVVSTAHGCSNGCVHCFVDAKPIKITDPSQIKAMSWEDFKSLTEGFAELDKRLGFSNTNLNPISKRQTLAPFFDSDSMEITLKDKHGIEHDMMEISHKISTNMHKPVIFDTAGWTQKNTKLQQRAEKYVKYMLETENKGIFAINLSLNPFHKMNSKYVEYIKSNPEKAQKFRNLYTDRMANVFYTFTPLFEKKELRFLNRALDMKSNCDENYKLEGHKQLIAEIREKLKARYISSGMSEENIRKNLEIFDAKTSQINTERIMAFGRLEKLFTPQDKEYIFAQKLHKKALKHPAKALVNHYWSQLLIDCDGKIYLTNQADFCPTDICLNFENKNKISRFSYPIINKTITTEEIMKETKKITLKKIFNPILQYFWKTIYYLKRL